MNHNTINRIVIACLCTLTIASCSTQDIIIEGFDSHEWKFDSLACNKYRSTHFYKILNNKRNLIGTTRSNILEFLGKANRTAVDLNGVSYMYFIDEGAQCKKNKDHFDSLSIMDNRLLIIEVNSKDTVDFVGAIVP